MRYNNQEFTAYVSHLQADHRRVQELVSEIEEGWGKLRFSTPQQVFRVVQQLETLRAELARHFDDEESGGCLEEAVSRHPGLGPDVNRLEQQHPTMLQQLDALIVRLTGIAQTAQELEEARIDFSEFARSLREHESTECRMLEQSFDRQLE